MIFICWMNLIAYVYTITLRDREISTIPDGQIGKNILSLTIFVADRKGSPRYFAILSFAFIALKFHGR